MSGESRSGSMVAWMLALVLGAGFVGTRKPGGPSDAPTGKPATQGDAQRTGQETLGEATLRPYLEFIRKRPRNQTYLPEEVTLRVGADQRIERTVKGPRGGSLERIQNTLRATESLPIEPPAPSPLDQAAMDPHFQAILAMVPDPAYSELALAFDQGVQAIRHSFHDLGWYSAGAWIPEMEPAPRDGGPGRLRTQPRSLLFVRALRSPIDRTLVEKTDVSLSGPWEGEFEKRLVILVPETPAMGPARESLLIAVDLLASLEEKRNANPAFKIHASVSKWPVGMIFQTYQSFLASTKPTQLTPQEAQAFQQESEVVDAAMEAAKKAIDFDARVMEEALAFDSKADARLQPDVPMESPTAPSTPIPPLYWAWALHPHPEFPFPEPGSPKLKAFAEPGQTRQLTNLYALSNALTDLDRLTEHPPSPGPELRQERLRILGTGLRSALYRYFRSETRFLRVLGPSYSGSAADLALAIRQRWPKSLPVLLISTGSTLNPLREPESWAPTTSGAPSLSTTSRWNVFWPETWTFAALPARSGTSEGPMRDLLKDMGLPHDRWAEISESDTAFGMAKAKAPWDIATDLLYPAEEQRKGWSTSFKVPSNLSSLRQARALQGSEEVAFAKPIKDLVDRLGPLEFRAGRQEDRALHPVDPNTPVDIDLGIQNMLTEIQQRNLKAVRISMSSLENAMFLARRVHDHIPDATLLVESPNQLFLHPSMASELEGAFFVGNLPPFPSRIFSPPAGTGGAPSSEQLHSEDSDSLRRGYLDEVTGFTRDGLWLLEHLAPSTSAVDWKNTQPGGMKWVISSPGMGTRFLTWTPVPTAKGHLRLRRQIWISQMRHGQFHPVHADWESLSVGRTQARETPFDVILDPSSREDPVSIAKPSASDSPALEDHISLQIRRVQTEMGLGQRLLHPLFIFLVFSLAVGPQNVRRTLLPNPASEKMSHRFSHLGQLLMGLLLLSLPIQMLSPVAADLLLLAATPEAWSGAFMTLHLLVNALAVGGLALMAWIVWQWSGSIQWTMLPHPLERTLSLPAKWTIQLRRRVMDRWFLPTSALAGLIIALVVLTSLWVSARQGLRGEAPAHGFFLLLSQHAPFWGANALPTALAFSSLLALAAFSLELQAYYARRMQGQSLEPLFDQDAMGSKEAAAELTLDLMVPWGFSSRRRLILAAFLLLVGNLGFLAEAWRVAGLGTRVAYPGILIASTLGMGFSLLLVMRTHRLWHRLEALTDVFRFATWSSAYEGVGKIYAWRPTKGFHILGEGHPYQSFHAFLDQLQLLSQAQAHPSPDPAFTRILVASEHLATKLEETGALLRAREALWKEAGDPRGKDILLVHDMDRIIDDLLCDLRRMGRMGDFPLLFGFRTYVFFRRALVQVKFSALTALGITLLLLIAATTGIQGRHLLSGIFFLALALQVVLIGRILVSIERNGLFSAVAGTTAGSVEWSSDLAFAMAKPALLLGCGYLLTRFPSLAGALQSLSSGS